MNLFGVSRDALEHEESFRKQHDAELQRQLNLQRQLTDKLAKQVNELTVLVGRVTRFKVETHDSSYVSPSDIAPTRTPRWLARFVKSHTPAKEDYVRED